MSMIMFIIKINIANHTFLRTQIANLYMERPQDSEVIDHGVSSFGLRVGDFRFRASDFRISGFGFVFCVFCFVWGVEVWEFQISSFGLEFRGSGSGSRSSARGWRLGRPEARNDHQAHAERPRKPRHSCRDRKVDIRLPGKGDSHFHGAWPIY